MKNPSLKSIWIMFGLFILLFIFNLSLTPHESATPRIWLVLDGWALVLSVLLLLRYKLPTKKHRALSLLLGVLVASAYLPFIKNGWYSLISGFVVTAVAALAVFRTFEVYRETAYICFIAREKAAYSAASRSGLVLVCSGAL